MTATIPQQKVDIGERVIVGIWAGGEKRIATCEEVDYREVDGVPSFFYRCRIWGGVHAMTEQMKASRMNPGRDDTIWFNDGEVTYEPAYLAKAHKEGFQA